MCFTVIGKTSSSARNQCQSNLFTFANDKQGTALSMIRKQEVTHHPVYWGCAKHRWTTSLLITLIPSKQPRLTNLQGTWRCVNSYHQIYAESSTEEETYIPSQWDIVSSLPLSLMERDFRRSMLFLASYQWLYNAWDDSAANYLLLCGADWLAGWEYLLW